MKFIPVSDLHLDVHSIRKDFWLDFDKGAVLILAGDASNSLNAMNYIKHILCRHFRAVVMVAGNHEWYSKKNTELRRNTYRFNKEYLTNVNYNRLMKNSSIKRLKKHENEIENFHILDNEVLIIDGVTLYGGSLWFPINKFSDNQKSDYILLMNDAKYINFQLIEEQYREFIQNFPEKVDIVISHHLPNKSAFANKEEAERDLAPFYHADLSDELISRTKFWISGHQHHAVEKIIANKVNYISNAKGYESMRPGILKNKVYEV